MFHDSADDIARAASLAATEYQVTDGLAQDWLKPTTMLLIDHMLPPEDRNEKGTYARGREMWLAVNSMQKDENRAWVSGKRSSFEVEHYEVLVDFHVFAGYSFPYRTVLTAESEGYRPAVARLSNLHLDRDGADWPGNGLLWDAWKLLIVPSPLRLFTTIATREQFDGLVPRYSLMLSLSAVSGGFNDSTFHLVAFDPTSGDSADVHVARWGSGQWEAEPDVQHRALSDTSTD